MEIKDKRVTVVGLARSGEGAANLMSEMGALVTVTDIKPEGELTDSVKKLAPSVRLALGGHPDEIFMDSDMIIISPGVPMDIKQLKAAKTRGVPVIGELELAYQMLQQPGAENKRPEVEGPIPFLAVTGSNGKSTTTTLLDLMMKKGGFKTLLGGNIGNALTGEILKKIRGRGAEAGSRGFDCVVVEVSSFQLEAIDKFRPHVASILNITPDHMDRYHSMEEYSDAKSRIFLNQRESDYLLLNADDPGTMKVQGSRFKVQGNKPKVLFFSRNKDVHGVYYKDGKVYCNIPDPGDAPCPMLLIDAEEIKIKGVHNLENAMAASAMALLAGCPPEAVIDSLREFGGLEHRLELVRELEGVKYINDSKGTNVGAVIKSLESFREPLILIAGGRDKAGDFAALRGLVAEKTRAVVLIGEAAGKIRDALGDIAETIITKDLKEAVEVSRGIARQGDVVLLSPACASFDMFKDFEDRGRQFKKIVTGLGEKNE
ncbi:MAG: UDP-N-acetylmuramoyl-L-alanine--D-glutamate ligase [Nitrospirota bacterium]